VDVPAVARHCLIDRVIYNLIDEVMKATRGCITDIHSWPQPDGFNSLKHADARARVIRDYRLIDHVPKILLAITHLFIERPMGWT
jgi:hypothetical protein